MAEPDDATVYSSSEDETEDSSEPSSSAHRSKHAHAHARASMSSGEARHDAFHALETGSARGGSLGVNDAAPLVAGPRRRRVPDLFVAEPAVVFTKRPHAKSSEQPHARAERRVGPDPAARKPGATPPDAAAGAARKRGRPPKITTAAPPRAQEAQAPAQPHEAQAPDAHTPELQPPQTQAKAGSSASAVERLATFSGRARVKPQLYVAEDASSNLAKLKGRDKVKTPGADANAKGNGAKSKALKPGRSAAQGESAAPPKRTASGESAASAASARADDVEAEAAAAALACASSVSPASAREEEAPRWMSLVTKDGRPHAKPGRKPKSQTKPGQEVETAATLAAAEPEAPPELETTLSGRVRKRTELYVAEDASSNLAKLKQRARHE